MAKKEKDDDLLIEIRERLKVAIDAEAQNRETFLEDTKFENGEQWDQQARNEREQNGRPCVTINKSSGTFKQITGESRQNKIAIKVRPVDGNTDPAVANIFNGLIRNIENISNADTAYNTALSNSTRGGWGYFRVVTDYSSEDAFDQDIYIRRINNTLSVYQDPAAQQLDRSDAGWGFILDTKTEDQFEKEYPDSKLLGHSSLDYGLGDQERTWVGKKTVQVAEYFRVVYDKDVLYQLEDGRTVRKSEVEKDGGKIVDRKDLVQGFVTPGKYNFPEGKYIEIGAERINITNEREVQYPKVEWYKTNGAEILEGPIPWAGKYIPIIFVAGDEIWENGRQILRSAIKWSKDPIRLYNWARSTSIETMAMAPRQPWLVTAEEIKDFEDDWDNANTRPTPYLLFNQQPSGSRPQRQQGTTPDMGAQNEAMMASDDIKSTTGLFDASLGAQSNETSGKAIIARQRQGNTGTFLFIDNLAVGINFLAKILVDLIPKIIDTERVVRLLNPDGSEAWETVNRTVIPDPSKPNETIVLNDLSVGKYDVTVSVGPAYITQRIEAAEGMIDLVQAAPQYMPIIAPRLAKNMDWPESDEIAEEMKGMAGGEQQGPTPEDEVDMINKTLTADGKELSNAKKRLDLSSQVQEQDDRTKALIVEALQGLRLVPNTP